MSREELNIEDGLANPDVYILDPCCGTGAYLVEVLRYITDTLQENGSGALAMALVKKAAIERIFGFEILTAPFVVAHLQLGLFLQSLGVPLIEDSERVGVYLTNALTGWQPPDEESKQKIQQLQLNFPELNKEREAADEVKRGKPILVILGNPPYNAFAGTSPTEEAGLVEVYKQGLISDWGIKKFNLDELYVRFFRLAERCISENTGKGVVCYISNYSWVSEPSFVILRQNLLKNFNKFWIENMHGNRKISEYAPDGRTSETIFSIPGFSAGIKQGVVISLWLKDNSQQGTKVLFRDDIDAAKAVERRSQLLDSLNNQDFDDFYQVSNPEQSNRYSFRPSDVSSQYLAWPKLTDLCADSPITGYKENRGYSFIDTDKTILTERISQYFDKNVSWEDLERLNTGLTKDVAGFDAKKARDKILKLQEKFNQKMLLRYLLRPYEVKWCYYTQVTPLWNRARPSLFIHQFQGNSFLVSRPAGVATPEGIPFYFTNCLGDFDFIRGHAYHFPMRLRQNYSETVNTEDNTQGKLFDSSDFNTSQIKANLSEKSRQYLKQMGINNLEENIENASLIWLHALAIGYSPLYLQENADGIRQDFPRIPLPNSQELLIKSAELGQAIASLLDTENPVIGVTKKPTPALQKIALISCTDGVNLNPDKGDLIINVGWGHGGKNGVTMPGKGKAIARQYTTAEMSVISPEMRKLLGTKTYDIYLNDRAYWQNIPSRVWEYTIGGYQVIKKWLSYREEKLLGRGLTIAEVQEVSEMTRRITAIILLESDLDDNYQNIKTAVYSF